MNTETSPQRFHKQIQIGENESQIKASALLAEQCDLSKQKIKKAMQHGAVWITQGKKTKRLRRADKLLPKGSIVHLYYDESLLAQVPPEPKLIKDEEQYSVWYKPFGLLSQGSKWGDYHTINRYAELNLKPQRPAFIVHRLDRAASGLIVVAHTKHAAAKLSKLFQDREITKIYRAVVEGIFSEDELSINTSIEGKKAISHVRKIGLEEASERSLLEISIETGRKHQIRRHLSEQGFPIEGDRLYGQAAKDHRDLQLTAIHLAFICPLTGMKKQYNLEPELQAQF